MQILRSSLLWVCVAALLGMPQLANAGIEHSAVVLKDPANLTPQLVVTVAVPKPHVDAIGQIGDTIFAGGLFEAVLAPTNIQSVRSHFVAFDAATGALKENQTDSSAYTDPLFNGQIWAIATYTDGAGKDWVYVGGDFTEVRGIPRGRIVKLDAATGEVDLNFTASFAAGIVWDLKIWTPPGSTAPLLVVAGSVGKKLMALDPTTGRNNSYIDLGVADPVSVYDSSGQLVSAWGGVAVYKVAINPDGTKLVATGNFRTVSNQSRTRLFVANLTGPAPSATLDPWYYPGFEKPCSSTNPRRIAYLQGVDFAPDGSYFVVTATGQIPKDRPADIWGVNGQGPLPTVCDAAGRFNIGLPDGDDAPIWINYTGGDSVWAVSVTGAAVYVQGHFQWLDNPLGYASKGITNVEQNVFPQQRYGIGAIDPNSGSGKALSWNPPKRAQIGGKVLLATPTGLWVGSDSERFNNELHRGIAFAPLPDSAR